MDKLSRRDHDHPLWGNNGYEEYPDFTEEDILRAISWTWYVRMNDHPSAGEDDGETAPDEVC